MDQISGLMPQVGWSPMMAAIPPKKAPATTVEPAATAANTNSGLGAETNTQSQRDKVVQLQSRGRDLAVEAAVLAQSRAAAQADPDAITGPPPTFDVSPLEAKAAAMREMPPRDANPAPLTEAAQDAPQSEASSAEIEAATSPAQQPPTQSVSAEPSESSGAEATTASQPQTGTEPTAAPQQAPKPEHVAAHAASDWQATADTAEPSLDVTR